MTAPNPTIVTDKADVKKAVAAFGYDGQKCSATSRLYVHKRIKNRFLDELVKETSGLKVGDPRRREVFMGPVINKRAVENFKQYVEMAKTGGNPLRRRCIGRRPIRQRLRSAYDNRPFLICL
ncbi:MAG: aldehyde dehydrogenase family protein [Candidatus Caldarchaeum sp.]